MENSFSVLLLTHLVAVTGAIVFDKFGTKTAYNASFSDSTNHTNDANKSHSCHPVHVSVVLRHGIRYPSASDVHSVLRIVQEFRKHGAKPDIVDELETVIQRYLPAEKDKKLAINGEIEQQHMGYRLGSKYRKLYSTADYEHVLYLSSSSERTLQSCLHFQIGFAEHHRLNVSKAIRIRDDLLRFFDFCPRYNKEVRKNESAFIEQIRFDKMINHLLSRDIGRYLNISDLQIDPDDIMSIYKIAACEVAIVGSHHWADVLNLVDLNRLQYSDDLEEYWKLGYGYPINYLQSCPLLVDIFRHMDNVVNGQSSTKGVFYFGHAETLLPLMTLLGLFKDNDTLRADNYRAQRHREFVTSRIVPFSSNLGFTLYRCHPSDNDFRLKIMFKERPITLPHVCPSTVLCPYDAVRKHYSQYIDDCNFNKLCSLKGSPIAATDSATLRFTLLSFNLLCFLSASLVCIYLMYCTRFI